MRSGPPANDVALPGNRAAGRPAAHSQRPWPDHRETARRPASGPPRRRPTDRFRAGFGHHRDNPRANREIAAAKCPIVRLRQASHDGPEPNVQARWLVQAGLGTPVAAMSNAPACSNSPISRKAAAAPVYPPRFCGTRVRTSAHRRTASGQSRRWCATQANSRNGPGSCGNRRIASVRSDSACSNCPSSRNATAALVYPPGCCGTRSRTTDHRRKVSGQSRR